MEQMISGSNWPRLPRSAIPTIHCQLPIVQSQTCPKKEAMKGLCWRVHLKE
jgi:hypothetical protein